MDRFDQQWHSARALEQAGLLVDDVWSRYVSLGGTTDAVGVTAYLCGNLLLTSLQGDLIAYAVKDVLTWDHGTDRHQESTELHANPHTGLGAGSASAAVTLSSVMIDDQLRIHGHPPAWPVLRVRLSVMFDPDEAEPRRLASLQRTGLMDSGREERFDRFTRLTRARFGVGSAAISLITDTRQIIKSTAGSLGMHLPRDMSFCTHAIAQDRTLVVLDTTDDGLFTSNPLVTDRPHLRFYAGHPLTGPGDWRIGALCLLDTKRRTFDERDRKDLRDLAGLVQAEIVETSKCT